MAANPVKMFNFARYYGLQSGRIVIILKLFKSSFFYDRAISPKNLVLLKKYLDKKSSKVVVSTYNFILF